MLLAEVGQFPETEFLTLAAGTRLIITAPLACQGPPGYGVKVQQSLLSRAWLAGQPPHWALVDRGPAASPWTRDCHSSPIR